MSLEEDSTGLSFASELRNV